MISAILPAGDPQRHERRARPPTSGKFARGNDLRNAAALRVGEEAPRQEQSETEAERRDRHRGIALQSEKILPLGLRGIGQQRHARRRAADQKAADEEEDAPAPALHQARAETV